MQIAYGAVAVAVATLIALVVYLLTYVARLRRQVSNRKELLALSRMGACPDRPPDLHVVLDSERACAVKRSPASGAERQLRVSAAVLVIGAVAATVTASSTRPDEMPGTLALPSMSNVFAEPQSVPVSPADLSPSSVAQPPSSTAAPDVAPTVRSPSSVGRPAGSATTPGRPSSPPVAPQFPSSSPSSLRSGNPQPSPSDDEPLCVDTVQAGVRVKVCPLD
jgi:hypothetical protein